MTAKIYDIGNMDCANCAREVEDGVRRLSGVQQVQVDFATGKMRLDGDVDFASLRGRVEALGKTISDSDAAHEHAHSHETAGESAHNFLTYLTKRTETRLALLAGGIIIIGLVLSLLGAASIASVLFVLATVIALLPIARSGINTLRINHDFNINLLMTVAAIGAILIGQVLEAATVIFLFAIGEALEGYTADRARDSLRQLMQLVPATATRLRRAAMQSSANENFIPIGIPLAVREEAVPVESLAIGDTIFVKPGERIPMDGIVTTGSSGVNQAPITGESIPVPKTKDAEVFAGSINGEGALEIRVTRRAADNTLSRIIKLVEEAQSVRAPSQRMIDRFARYYTPGVMVLAGAVAVLPPLLFNAPFYSLADGTQGWLYRALELLVIACPCSLVISTPVTIISAITAAARRGVLIKGGAHLEALGTIRAIAFDKTGTLTQGKPALTQMRAVDCETGEACERCDDVLALASAVEQGSTHPLAQAVVKAAQTRGLAGHYAPALAVTALAGRGVQGQVNGKLVTLGNHALFEAEHPHSHELCDWVDNAEAHGQTAMLLCDGDRVRGFIAMADQPRAESQTVVKELHNLDIQTVMLTGDNDAVARSVGRDVGVDEVRASLLPADKVTAIKALLAQQGATAMVGDGINDTPALAAATVGIAMGGAGSAQALETADIALMADDLRQLPYALRLSRFARSLIRQNIGISLGLKAAVMLLALAGSGTLWLAVFADVGMSLIVTANGMRPLRMRG
ncbi:MAG: cation-translocating P-type ATPase [Anaerolineae bacterium]